MNVLWLGLVLVSLILGLWQNRLDIVIQSVNTSAKFAFELSLSLAGISCFWLGLMKIAEDCGLVHKLSRTLRPLMGWLFPEIPSDHPAISAILMNISANLFGLNNAATPFGLRAMQQLQAINPDKTRASHAMCMFLGINTSSLQLIPTTAISFLASAGAKHPTDIIFPALLATSCSTIAAILVAKLAAKWSDR